MLSVFVSDWPVFYTAGKFISRNDDILYSLYPGGNTPQNSRCTATYHPLRKLSKLDEPDMRDTDKLICGVLLWTPLYGRTKAGRPARTYIQQLCADAGCIPEDLPEAMDDWEGWRERVRDVRADGATWWWRWSYPCLTNRFCVVVWVGTRRVLW